MWLLGGCLFLAAVAFAVCVVWPRVFLRPLAPWMVDGFGETAPETPLPAAYFDLTASGRTTITQTSGTQVLDGRVELKYAHQKTDGGIFLNLYSMGLNLKQDGTVTDDSVMTRDKIVEGEGFQKVETDFSDLEPEQQDAIAGAFATNLCKILLDANQNELGREIISQAGFSLVKEGSVNSMRLMHGPYYRGLADWDGVKRIPMTKGLVLDCPLHYARAGRRGDDIDISGTLSKPEVDSPESDVSMKDVLCKLSGEETYDESVGEYVSGKMTLSYHFQVLQGGVQVGTMDGTEDMVLKRVTNN